MRKTLTLLFTLTLLLSFSSILDARGGHGGGGRSGVRADRQAGGHPQARHEARRDLRDEGYYGGYGGDYEEGYWNEEYPNNPFPDDEVDEGIYKRNRAR